MRLIDADAADRYFETMIKEIEDKYKNDDKCMKNARKSKKQNGAAEETPKRKYPRGDKMSPNDFLLWKMLLGVQKDYYRRPTVRPDGSIETEAEVRARMQERFPEEFYLEMGDTEFKDFLHDARTGQVRFG